jgi:hypothetical protein
VLEAYADIAALKMMLKAVEFSGELAPGWENRLEAVRSTEMYQQYLRRGEAEIDAAERNQANARLGLVKHPEPGVHYTFFDQMAPQGLFAWAVYVTYGAYQAIINNPRSRYASSILFDVMRDETQESAGLKSPLRESA